MSWKKIPINKIFNFEKWTLQSSKNIPWDYNFITASSEWKTHSTYSHECEALVFAMAASWSLWRTHYVNGKFIASDLCFIITPKDEFKDKINLKFYYRYFNAIREILVKALATGSAKLSINAWNFWKYEVIIGDIEEQNKLIGKLDFIISKKTEISEYIESNIALSKKLKSSILQDAIQWKLVPQDPSDESASILIEKIQAEKTKLIAEWKLKKQKPLAPIKPEEIPYELPKGWEWVRLGEIVSIESNLVNPNQYPNFPHIAPDNIEKNTGKLLSYRTVIEDEINSSNHLFRPWHILYSKVRPKLNKAVIVDFEGLCSADMYPIKSYINKYYLKNVILSDMFLNQIDAYDNRIKMPKINQNDLSLILIPIPPEREQIRIVGKSNELIKTCEYLDKEIKQAKERSGKLMESVLQGVFNW